LSVPTLKAGPKKPAHAPRMAQSPDKTNLVKYWLIFGLEGRGRTRCKNAIFRHALPAPRIRVSARWIAIPEPSRAKKTHPRRSLGVMGGGIGRLFGKGNRPGDGWLIGNWRTPAAFRCLLLGSPRRLAWKACWPLALSAAWTLINIPSVSPCRYLSYPGPRVGGNR